MSKTLKSVKLVKPANILGNHTDQMSSAMVGITIAWEDGHVAVRRPETGQEEWIMPAGILSLVWEAK